MNGTAVEAGDFLLALRLANATAIERAYGAVARKAALDQIESGVNRCLDFLRTCRTGYDEVVVLGPKGLLSQDLVRRLVDSLCIRISLKPLEFAGTRILLAVDAGYSSPAEGPAKKVGLAMEAQARHRLAASSMRALVSNPSTPQEIERYRKDMDRASALLRAIGQGQGFFVWRPVYKAQSPERIVHYEAVLKLLDSRGTPIDYHEGAQALDRLGLAYLRDRQIVCHVLDELEADPNATLSIQLSSSSLSFDLHGQGVAWTDLILRLRQQPDLARRLIVEVAEPTPDRILPAAKVFVQSLKAAGVRIAIAGFGSDFSSIRQMLTFEPDIIKLPGGFLQSMKGKDRRDIGLRHLIGLARTLAGMVVVDGVETAEDIRQARKEGGEWLVGNLLGAMPRQGRPDLCPAYVPYTRDSEILRCLHSTAGYYAPCFEEAPSPLFRQNLFG